MAQQVLDAGCGSVVTVTYSADGADFMEVGLEAASGLSPMPAFGGDGIASEDWISYFSAPAAAKQLIWYLLLQNQLHQQVGSFRR